MKLSPAVLLATVTALIKDLNNLVPQGSGWVLDDANGSNDAGQSVGLRHGQRANTSVLVEMICEVTPEPNWESLTLVSREVEASGTTGDLQQTKCCATA